MDNSRKEKRKCGKGGDIRKRVCLGEGREGNWDENWGVFRGVEEGCDGMFSMKVWGGGGGGICKRKGYEM